jgi:hypothetical protein
MRQARGRAGAARRDDGDVGALVGRGADPARVDPNAVLALQRKAGNRATVQLLRGTAVQRDLTKTAKPKGAFVGSRPNSVKALDVALATLTDKMSMPGALDPIKAALVAVRTAIADFRGSKDGAGKWAGSVAALEGEVKAKEAEVDKQIAAKAAKKQVGQDRFAVFTTLEPELAKYAKRAMYDATMFQEDATGPSIKSALSGPREAGGELTKGAVKEMNENQQQFEVPKETKSGQAMTFAGLSLDDVRAFMKAHTNALTGKTMYPELQNVTDPTGQPDKVVTSMVDLGGVSMPVEHNPSDVNLDERLKLVKDAIAKITAAGVQVPITKIHLPKYGRGLALKKATDDAGGQIQCEENVKSSRAVFIPPDFMHLSSEVIGTPNLNKVTNPATGKEEWEFSSTGFDPSGVATIVHEFGHAIHMVAAPTKYHGLWGTAFTGETESGKGTLDVAKAEVSTYAGKPREFVAEVFLGLVYGKEFSEDVMSMYRSFGGPIPPAATIKAAVKAL